MLGTLTVDPKTKKILNTPSLYHPSEEVRNFTMQVRQDYQIGYEIMGLS